MKAFARYLSANTISITFTASITLLSSQAYAWVPCQLICDTQCIGTEMALQSLSYLEKQNQINDALVESISKVSEATESSKNMGDNVVESWNNLSKMAEDTVITDSVLNQSTTSRAISAIDGYGTVISSEIAKHINSNEKLILDKRNGVFGAATSILKLTNNTLIESNTSDLVSQNVQNNYEISNYFNRKNSLYNSNVPQIFLIEEKLDGVNQKSSVKKKAQKDAISYVEEVILGLNDIDSDSWEKIGYLPEKPNHLAYPLITYNTDHNIPDYQEFSDLDYDKLVRGSKIDLQGLQLLKTHRNNLFLQQTLEAKNHIIE